MSNVFKVEIVNPEKSFLSREDVNEVVVPAFEGDMGILKDHISIISFLKPGIVKIIKSSENVNSFFVEEGIIEFYNNSLIVLSRKIVDIKNLNKEEIEQLIKETEKILNNEKLHDNDRYLANHKIEVLRTLSIN